MTVWIVYMNMQHEGYSEPKHVFSSREKAESFCDEVNSSIPDWHGVSWEYEELTVED